AMPFAFALQGILPACAVHNQGHDLGLGQAGTDETGGNRGIGLGGRVVICRANAIQQGQRAAAGGAAGGPFGSGWRRRVGGWAGGGGGGTVVSRLECPGVMLAQVIFDAVERIPALRLQPRDPNDPRRVVLEIERAWWAQYARAVEDRIGPAVGTAAY